MLDFELRSAREDLVEDHAITLHAAAVKLPAFALFVTEGVWRRRTPAGRPPSIHWFKLLLLHEWHV